MDRFVNRGQANFMLEMVRSFDHLGIPVSLTYNKQHSYKTLCGGCISTCAFISIILFVVKVMILELAMADFNEQTYERHLKLTENAEAFNFTVEEMAMAVRLDDNNVHRV